MVAIVATLKDLVKKNVIYRSESMGTLFLTLQNAWQMEIGFSPSADRSGERCPEEVGEEEVSDE